MDKFEKKFLRPKFNLQTLQWAVDRGWVSHEKNTENQTQPFHTVTGS